MGSTTIYSAFSGTRNSIDLTGASANQVIGVNAENNATEFKTISAGSNVTVTHTENTITISATGGSSGFAHSFMF
jgi:hypothetical protein